MSRYFNSACVSPPGAGLGVGEVVGVGFGGSVPGTIVPVIAVALTVPAGVIVAVSEVALGPGDDSVAAPPHAAMAPTNRSAQTRMPLGTAGPPVRFPLPRPPAANVTGRIHVKAEGQDLVVDPAGVEHRFLRLIPSWCAVLQQILLPDDKPDHAVMVRHPHELRGEPIDRNDFEGEADDETVALVLPSERNSQAHDGAEALRVVQEDPPSVVVLDVQMPGMDGPSFARELRMALRRVPLVILTGVADPRHEADRCNAEAYLAKPFDANELVSVVRRFAA